MTRRSGDGSLIFKNIAFITIDSRLKWDSSKI